MSYVFEYRHELTTIIAVFSMMVFFVGSRQHQAGLSGFPEMLAYNYAGWLLIIAGIALRLWAALYIGGNKNRRLVRAGPYSLIRNPLYFGNFLSAIGVMLLSESLSASLLMGMGLFVIYRGTIAHEEAKLLGFFGDEYREYIRTVPRLWPRLADIRTLLREGCCDTISYRNVVRELKRGAVFCLVGILVQSAPMLFSF
ncbi:MAG: methyltransferase family protein [Gammaproteobacteria bacterium]